jgi:hypothetical protein
MIAQDLAKIGDGLIVIACVRGKRSTQPQGIGVAPILLQHLFEQRQGRFPLVFGEMDPRHHHAGGEAAHTQTVFGDDLLQCCQRLSPLVLSGLEVGEAELIGVFVGLGLDQTLELRLRRRGAVPALDQLDEHQLGLGAANARAYRLAEHRARVFETVLADVKLSESHPVRKLIRLQCDQLMADRRRRIPLTGINKRFILSSRRGTLF